MCVTALKVLTHLKPPRHFCMLLFEVLPFTDDASVVNGKTSKTSVQKGRGVFLCVKALKVLTHLKPPHRFCMLFIDVLPFTDDASVVNGKTSKKTVQKRRRGFRCVKT